MQAGILKRLSAYQANNAIYRRRPKTRKYLMTSAIYFRTFGLSDLRTLFQHAQFFTNFSERCYSLV